MVKVSSLVAASIGIAYTAAAPADLVERAGCTFTDAASAISGKTGCTTITLNGIAVPAGTTLDLTGLQAGTSVIFQGTTTFGHKQWEGPLISISGTNIKVSGASGHVIDGNGAAWWDGEGSNSKTNIKPKFFYAHNLKGKSSIKGLHVKNTPVQGFSIDGSSGLTLDSITIDNSAGASLGHNTDGFDIGDSSDITISNSHVTNQDDCLAVNSGTNIKFIGNTCIGGHGISIGSVGGRSNNVVNGVTVQNCNIQDSENGVRIKTVSGATGSVTQVTYDGIVLSNIAKYGLVIQQDYENGKPTGTPTAGVPITHLTLHNITGTVESTGFNKYILCASGACSSWTTSLINIHGGKTSTACTGIPSGSGITC
ncbi:Endopolygalacturonase [Lasiodiplodia theobromae]|uniref:Endopolygalacturonase n=1 Tax=Lasiodiplodia theobromae TaxID=45133 RepID=UPI0015C2F4C8|nr:Endopolygalacturonase [Lasiodiplodia theobromae]KAF4546527.1 Endopolygalacturonase [Lasiodiplodia theobromae]